MGLGGRGWRGGFEHVSTDIEFGIVDESFLTSAIFVLAAVSGIFGASGTVSSESDVTLFAFAIVTDKFFVFGTGWVRKKRYCLVGGSW